jgi:hypothetical protein
MTEREAAEQRMKTLLQGIDLELTPREELELSSGHRGAHDRRLVRGVDEGSTTMAEMERMTADEVVRQLLDDPRAPTWCASRCAGSCSS